MVFSKEVVYAAKEPSPWASDGKWDSIELFYFIGDTEFDIEKKAKQYSDQIPTGFLPFAEAAGGNQICIDIKTGAILFWDHESEPNAQELFFIAKSISDFLKILRESPSSESDGNDDSGLVSMRLDDDL